MQSRPVLYGYVEAWAVDKALRTCADLPHVQPPNPPCPRYCLGRRVGDAPHPTPAAPLGRRFFHPPGHGCCGFRLWHFLWQLAGAPRLFPFAAFRLTLRAIGRMGSALAQSLPAPVRRAAMPSRRQPHCPGRPNQRRPGRSGLLALLRSTLFFPLATHPSFPHRPKSLHDKLGPPRHHFRAPLGMATPPAPSPCLPLLHKKGENPGLRGGYWGPGGLVLNACELGARIFSAFAEKTHTPVPSPVEASDGIHFDGNPVKCQENLTLCQSSA